MIYECPCWFLNISGLTWNLVFKITLWMFLGLKTKSSRPYQFMFADDRHTHLMSWICLKWVPCLRFSKLAGTYKGTVAIVGWFNWIKYCKLLSD